MLCGSDDHDGVLCDGQMHQWLQLQCILEWWLRNKCCDKSVRVESGNAKTARAGAGTPLTCELSSSALVIGAEEGWPYLLSPPVKSPWGAQGTAQVLSEPESEGSGLTLAASPAHTEMHHA